MTGRQPTREEIRRYHEHKGWWLVAWTDDIDIWTLIVEKHDRHLVRVLDCDGTRVAHRYVMPAAAVARTVAAHIGPGMTS